MHKQVKKAYQAPTIKVVEMKVERGFAGTNVAISNNGTANVDQWTEVSGTAANDWNNAWN